jgi:hypothetical protein
MLRQGRSGSGGLAAAVWASYHPIRAVIGPGVHQRAGQSLRSAAREMNDAAGGDVLPLVPAARSHERRLQAIVSGDVALGCV